MNPALCEFLRGECLRRGLSLRSLSINSGLSPATVSNVLNREYQPTLDTLIKLADYLEVRREYLWQLAGLIEDTGDGLGGGGSDARLKAYCIRIAALSRPARDMVFRLIDTALDYAQSRSVLEAPETTVAQQPQVAEEQASYEQEEPDNPYS